MLTKPELAITAIETAEKIGVDPALVCAVIEVASGWDAGMTEWCPTPWLRTQEPADLGGVEAWRALGTRWGPMQVLGQEAFFAGYKEVMKLAVIEANLEAGCLVLKKILAAEKGDERNAIYLYFGREGKERARKALAMKPLFTDFVGANPHEKMAAASPDSVSTA